MAVLSRSSILRAVQADQLGIEPFFNDALQPASYDMRLHWKLLISPTRFQPGKEVDLRTEAGRKYEVETGRFVGILTEERLTMPLWLSGRFGLRSEFTRHGLVAFGGIQIDPGFRGRLAISLFNAGPEPVDMVYERPMFTVEFNTLDAPVEEGYAGPFQGFEDFHPVQREFILNAQTASLAEIREFPRQLANIQLRLAQVEGRQDTGQPKSVQELARIQGVSPLHDLSVLAGGWPDDEDLDQFIETVRQWRQQGSR